MDDKLKTCEQFETFFPKLYSSPYSQQNPPVDTNPVPNMTLLGHTAVATITASLRVHFTPDSNNIIPLVPTKYKGNPKEQTTCHAATAIVSLPTEVYILVSKMFWCFFKAYQILSQLLIKKNKLNNANDSSIPNYLKLDVKMTPLGHIKDNAIFISMLVALIDTYHPAINQNKKN